MSNVYLRKLSALGVFEGPAEYLVKVREPDMIFEFKITPHRKDNTLSVTHLGPFAHTTSPMARLNQTYLERNQLYPAELIWKVFEELEKQLIAANSERQTTTATTPQVDKIEGQEGHGGDWFSAGVTSGHLATPLDNLVRRGVFRCKLPDILIGTAVVRVDKENPQDPVLKIGFWTVRNDSPDIRWILNYALQRRKLDTLPGEMPVPVYTALVSQVLINYDKILDGFVANAEYALLE